MKVINPSGDWDSIPLNGVLRTKAEADRSIALTKAFGLPLHVDPVKNWDSLAAWSVITRFSAGKKRARILDAGGEFYSVILRQLQQTGFTDLTCINLVFNTSVVKGGIRFQFGDITATNFQKNKFDAIACLSVIEHGVDPGHYFKEMSRILKPGGILFTSTDYWTTPIDTFGQEAYGVPIRIFDRTEVNEMISLASDCELELMGELDLNCRRKVVSWKQFNLDYTFLYFTMRKRNLKFEV